MCINHSNQHPAQILERRRIFCFLERQVSTRPLTVNVITFSG